MKNILKYTSFIKKINENFIELGQVNDNSMYTNLRTQSIEEKDLINKTLLDDIAEAAKKAGVRVLITCGKSDHPHSAEYTSRHDLGLAVDISRIGYETTDFSKLPGSGGASRNKTDIVPEFVDAGNKIVEQLIGLGYKLCTQDTILKQKFSDYIVSSEGEGPKVILWRGHWGKGGNHYNHLHISNKTQDASSYVQPKIKPTDEFVPMPPKTNELGEKIYQIKGDPYQYKVENGIWYSLGGPANKIGTWEYFNQWTSLEQNCKATNILDTEFIGARTTQEIEKNNKRYCSTPQEVEENRKSWIKSVSGDKFTTSSTSIESQKSDKVI